MGQTNMDEFGMGSSTSHSAYGRCVNPWSTSQVSLVPGGSSGGSASVVAAGAAFGALGSDTGGSVRQPASHCGVVGLKPTYGLIPRFGLISYASSLDTPGLLARCVKDVALLLDGTAGADDRDPTCAPVPSSPGVYEAAVDSAACVSSSTCLRGLRVGIPEDFNVEELDPAVRTVWENSALSLAAAGASLVPVSIPSVPRALPAYVILASAEASSNLARYDGVRYGGGSIVHHSDGRTGSGGLCEQYSAVRSALFGAEVKRRILSGCFVLSESAYHAYYESALAIRAKLRLEFIHALSQVDVLLAPSAPAPPSPISTNVVHKSSAESFLDDIFTVPASLAGVPAMSVPAGTTQVVYDGYTVTAPIGMQLIGRPCGEAGLLIAAAQLEALVKFEGLVRR